MKSEIVISRGNDWRQLLVVLLTAVLTVFLAHRISKGVNIEELSSLMSNLAPTNLVWIGLAILLLVPNWIIEAGKLRLVLTQQNQRTARELSMVTCFKSVLTGVTLGIITPARLGEYGGRLVAFPKERRAQVIGATLVTSLGQTIVTLGIGLVCALVLLEEYQFLKTEWLLIGASVCIVAVLVGILYLPELISSLAKWPFINTKTKNDLEKSTKEVLSLSGICLAKVLGLSTLRYGVYTVQYLIVLRVLGVDASFLTLLLHIPLIFFLQTLMPLPPITSLVGRVSAAVVILTHLGPSDFVILTASSLVWVINLVIPAFLGLGLLWMALIDKSQ